MILVVLIIIALLIPKLSYAVADFTTYQQITYTLLEDNSVHVDHRVQLTNNISNIYAKEYQLSIASDKISDTHASDNFGDILSSTDIQNNQTKFILKFNQPSIGKGKTQDFTLKYQINNAITPKGKLMEVSLPDYGQLQDGDQIDITVISPNNFGNLAFSSVNSLGQNTASGYLSTFFKLTPESKSSKFLLAYGSAQLFDFKLSYFIKNDSNQSKTINIPIPPDTQNQTITYSDFSLWPSNIIVDQDGNWLAQYQLEAQSQQSIEVSGQAKILPISKPIEQSQNYLQSLTSSSPFWHPDSPTIQTIAATQKTPKQIYDYVVNTLSYNYDKINRAQRMGDLAILNDPSQALCTEFTDLFVAIARANKIPSREIEGYAYSNNDKIKPINPNSDILHAWPQYWDEQKGWVSIDPTWAKTTNGVDFFQDLDLNHLVFVIHGSDAQNPPPPGSFKQDNSSKTVDVQFASKELIHEHQNLIITTDTKNKTKLIVSNPNNQAVNNISLSNEQANWQQNIPIIPPFSKIILESPQLSFFDSINPDNQSLKIKVNESSQVYAVKTIYLSHYLNLAILICILIFLLSIGGIIITRTKK